MIPFLPVVQLLASAGSEAWETRCCDCCLARADAVSVGCGTRITYRASAHAPSHRKLVYLNDSGEIDLDGNSWRCAIGESVCEEYQYRYGRWGNILTCEAARRNQQVDIELSENDVDHDLLGQWAVWRGGEKREPKFGVAQET